MSAEIKIGSLYKLPPPAVKSVTTLHFLHAKDADGKSKVGYASQEHLAYIGWRNTFLVLEHVRINWYEEFKGIFYAVKILLTGQDVSGWIVLAGDFTNKDKIKDHILEVVC